MNSINIEDILKYKTKKKSHSDYTYGGWYLIINIKNNKGYVGKSIEFMNRIKSHINVKKPKTLIDKEIKKEGINNFRFYLLDTYKNHKIDFFTRKQEIIIENKLIKENKTFFPNGYNIRYYEWI